MKRLSLAAALALLAGPAIADMAICAGRDRAARNGTCVYDGATGWEGGRQWRLLDIDAPEIGARDAGCRAEQILAIRTRDRLRAMMSGGYTILHTGREDPYGQSLVKIKLADGRDVALQMMSEGIVQAWPNKGNRWCGR